MKMQNAEMKFISIDQRDVITTSGGPDVFKFNGLFDGTEKNAQIFRNGQEIYNAVNFDSNWTSEVEQALTKAGLTNVSLSSYIYEKGLTNRKNLENAFTTVDGAYYGDNNGSDSFFSFMNTGDFQWLNGARGWAFYQQ